MEHHHNNHQTICTVSSSTSNGNDSNSVSVISNITTNNNTIQNCVQQIQTHNSDRESRKRAEKHRRTVLNGLVGELAAMVPAVADSNRKIDKTGVLRLAAHDLRKEHVFGHSSTRLCHMDIGIHAADTLLDIIDGFALAATVKGIIVVVSPNIRSYLGHCQLDLLGQSIYNIVHPDDVDIFNRNLTPTPGELLCPKNAVVPVRRDFCVRLLRACPRGERPRYALCRIDGTFRRADRAKGDNEGRVVRRQRVRRDRAAVGGGDDVVFVAVARTLDTSPGSERLLEAYKLEYWTRHLVDGRIVYCDQRISLVAGYMSEEVTGLSGFTFMHKEDVRWVAIALRQMYDDSRPYGESFYRLLSRNGRCMYLWTRGFLEVDETTKVAQSFACINTLIHCDDEGLKMINAMRKKYSAIMELENDDSFAEPETREQETELILEDPIQLEQVVMHMLTDLPTPPPRRSPSITSCSDSSPTRSPIPNDLTIIPPQLSTIKSAIVKGVNVASLSKITKRSPNREDSEIVAKLPRPMESR